MEPLLTALIGKVSDPFVLALLGAVIVLYRRTHVAEDRKDEIMERTITAVEQSRSALDQLVRQFDRVDTLIAQMGLREAALDKLTPHSSPMQHTPSQAQATAAKRGRMGGDE